MGRWKSPTDPQLTSSFDDFQRRLRGYISSFIEDAIDRCNSDASELGYLVQPRFHSLRLSFCGMFVDDSPSQVNTALRTKMSWMHRIITDD